jgi:iron-sulfur cluster assembly protein/iron-sulfur cluster insertion protein
MSSRVGTTGLVAGIGKLTRLPLIFAGERKSRYRLINRRSEEDLMITLTETAASNVKELLAAEGASDLALRVAVRPGGCSGFSYEMFFDGDIAPDDEQAEFGEGVRVLVDPASAQLLLGASLDYKDGLNQAGFNITNPNASRSCGCGQSFS